MKYFFITENHYWSKGDTFVEAFNKLKTLTSQNKLRCVVKFTEDDEAYINEVDGGICYHDEKEPVLVGRFIRNSNQLKPVNEFDIK